MSDELQNLRATLAELHRQLESARSLDTDDQAAMRQVMADIEQALARSGTGGQTLTSQQAQRGSLVRRLTEAARGFESTHPTLSGAIGGVADALNSIGI
jgi:hypothetical protein